MNLKERNYSILIASSSNALNDALKLLLSDSIYNPVHIVPSISKAKLAMTERAYDFLIINSPLPDEQGINLSIDTCTTKNTIVLLLVKSEVHDEIYNKVAPHGVFTLPKPTSRNTIERGLAWMISARERFRHFDKKNMSIEQKMEEIRLVNRAKWMLISHKNLSEPDAHRLIEKMAMDRCVSRRDVADAIIKEYHQFTNNV